MKEFASYMKVGDNYLSMIWNGRRKLSKNIAPRLADLFMDERFYDVADLPRPDPHLSYINRNWEKVPGEGRKRLAEEVGKYSCERPPDQE